MKKDDTFKFALIEVMCERSSGDKSSAFFNCARETLEKLSFGEVYSLYVATSTKEQLKREWMRLSNIHYEMSFP